MTFRRLEHLQEKWERAPHRRAQKKQTDDTDLEVITWPPEEDFLFLSGGLLGRHSLLGVEDRGGGERSIE